MFSISAFQYLHMFSFIFYLFHCLLSSNWYPTMEAKADSRKLPISIKATVRPFLCILVRFEKKMIEFETDWNKCI